MDPAITPLAILVFGAIVLAIEMWAKTPGWGTDSTRIVGLTLVVVAALFLAIAFAQMRASQELAAAAFGLLGVVAGYLVGKS